MADYATVDELASFIRIDDQQEHVHLGALLTTASRAVDAHCGSTFETAAAAATARVFAVAFSDLAFVHPISSDTSLVVKTDTGGDGTYDQTWTSSDYQLEPLNQHKSGITDHPYTKIRAIESLRFPTGKRAHLEVTALWGWTSGTPDAVRDATIMHAVRLHERRNMPAGIVAGDGFVARSSLGIDPDVKMLLAPYVRADKWT